MPPSFASISALVGMLGAVGVDVLAGADDDAPVDGDEVSVARGGALCEAHPASAKLETSKNPRRLHLTGPACQVPAGSPVSCPDRRDGLDRDRLEWQGGIKDLR